jgi:hypothetical protein
LKVLEKAWAVVLSSVFHVLDRGIPVTKFVSLLAGASLFAVSSAQAASAPADFIITGGTVYTGADQPPTTVDVVIVGRPLYRKAHRQRRRENRFARLYRRPCPSRQLSELPRRQATRQLPVALPGLHHLDDRRRRRRHL